MSESQAGQSLWQRIDTALAAAFLAAMGEDGTYTTDVLAAVELTETWAPDKGPFPRLIVWSTVAETAIEGHGGAGKTHVKTVIPYFAVSIVDAASYTAARASAQTLHQRVIDVLRSGAAILATAQAADPNSAERAVRLTFDRGSSGIEIRGRQGPNQGIWRGLAIVAFQVETFV